MQGWIVKQVVAFILRQVAQYAHGTDWAKVKADAAARLATVVPKWAQTGLAEIVNAAVDVVAFVLADTADLAQVVDALAKQDWAGALAALKAIIGKVLPSPSTDTEKHVVAAVHALAA